MDLLQNPNQKQTTKLRKKRLTQDQVRQLESSFTANKRLLPDLKLHLANQLGIPPRQVAVWYQNKRARWKSQSLELDYTALQKKLETALTEKKRLEKDMEKLKGELEKTQKMLIDNFFNQAGLPFDHSVSCEEEGSSSCLHGREKLSSENPREVAHLDEEFYACLMDTGNDESLWD